MFVKMRLAMALFAAILPRIAAVALSDPAATSAPVSSTTTAATTSAAASSSFSIGLPPFRTVATASYMIEGNVTVTTVSTTSRTSTTATTTTTASNSLATPTGEKAMGAFSEGIYDPLSCATDASTVTESFYWSWEPTTMECRVYYSVPGLTIVPGKTGIFICPKDANCWETYSLDSTSGEPFDPEPGVWYNTGMPACAVEGTGPTSAQDGENWQMGNILQCQNACNLLQKCLSFSYDTTVPNTEKNCHLWSYSWTAELGITPNKTGIYYSDSNKSSNICFQANPFNATASATTSTAVSTIRA